ncbi:conserved hypothetical protein [Leishmania infantum JPCM5]|uniref:Uncharacterized protein n=2 Tax=Leishmania infantum TaxID=5671 RepID=A4I7H2_LEIIN|nr:conserved hypothetical protein [Leishmania infantum JPCM5]CAC9522707.1 hypothetical_protein_-_conserved [Leishmania infantum]CAM70756.1 conserved hypothetical protein [Leishmania infantum JPCM5]SUZ44573.1 hypothetical_protein_-_conserved [Leishmania infantum]|eukprot:XP_001467691.1 conserved hypothetical protein [Leishmania infantum JPCM5]
MGGSSDTIGVRTKHDREEEERDRKLIERIMEENQNPFQTLVDPLLEQASYVYNTYLYASGVMFLTLSFWGAYPSFVRFRHAHIFRYRRTQLSFRRGLFATEHMPKWNKNRLQRIVVPPLPTSDLVVVGSAAASPVHPTLYSPSAATSNVSVVAAADTAVTARPASNLDRRFDVMELSATRTPHGSFGGGDTEKSEHALSRELQSINRDFFGPQSRLFHRPIQENASARDLRQRLRAAVTTAKAVVVLVENHRTVRSIPEGWEVWWVSEPEARRRRFCKFWLGGLVCARAFQDLMDMPDMPDFIN